jgi:hypothetical protein
LKWIVDGSKEKAVPAAAVVSRPRRAWGLIAGLFFAIAVAGFGIWKLKPAPSAPITRSVFSLPPGEQLAGLGQTAVALSPSGNQMVHVAIQNNVQQL